MSHLLVGAPRPLRRRALHPLLVGALGLACAAALGCGDAPPIEPPPAPTAPVTASGHDHAAMGHDHAAMGNDHAAMGPDHAAGGDHMAAMGATRERLRERLGAAYDAPVPGLDAAVAARGATTYTAQCAACHGAAGAGDGPAALGLSPAPANFTDDAHSRFYSDAGRVEIIRSGSEGTAMAPFAGTLTEPEILDVYAFVASLRTTPQPGAASATQPADHGHDHGAHTH